MTGPYRISLTRTGRVWHWEVQHEFWGAWYRVGLLDDHMEGWSLSRSAALRRGNRKLRRYVNRMDRFRDAHREQVGVTVAV